MTESEKIWAEVKDVSIDLFNVPDQTIEKHVANLNVPGDVLLVKLKGIAGAALPAIETALKNKFSVEMDNGYVSIKRLPPKK